MADRVPYSRLFGRDPDRVNRESPDAMLPVARDKAASEIDIRKGKRGKGVGLTRADFGYGFDQVARGTDITSLKGHVAPLSSSWEDWVPSYSNLTLGTGATVIAKYKELAETIFWHLRIVLGTGGSSGGLIVVSLPEALPNIPTDVPVGSGYVNDATSGANRTLVSCVRNSGGTGFHMLCTGGSVGGTAPFTWAVNDSVNAVGHYPIL